MTAQLLHEICTDNDTSLKHHGQCNLLMPSVLTNKSLGMFNVHIVVGVRAPFTGRIFPSPEFTEKISFLIKSLLQFSLPLVVVTDMLIHVWKHKINNQLQ